MYHISDLKKYRKCPVLYLNEMRAPKTEYHPFVRLDQEVSELAAKKLHVSGKCYIGSTGDEKEKALEALKDCEWLIKSRFEYKTLRVTVPFLHRHDEGWDLYFMFVGLYPHADDLVHQSTTVWILEHNGIVIKDIRIIHLNAEYVRGKELDTEQLFVISDSLYNGKNNPTINLKKEVYRKMFDPEKYLEEMDHIESAEIHPERSTKCTARRKCKFYANCFPEEFEDSDNSIMTLFSSQYKTQMYKEGIRYLKDADIERVEGTRQQYSQIEADQNGGLFVDRIALKSWLGYISYPITFLDFEWERFAIPPYEGMKPYDVLPFEYSIHILHEDGTVDHKVYLNVHDDRRDMAQSLVRDIPKVGTVMAFNAVGAEEIRIREFAEQFEDLAEDLNNINARMEDLELIFESGVVYDTRMKGQWSLKVIMAMMNDRSYQDLDINQGMDAVFQWRHLDYSEENIDREKIVSDLKKYCGMDTYAMTVVYQWLVSLTEDVNFL